MDGLGKDVQNHRLEHNIAVERMRSEAIDEHPDGWREQVLMGGWGRGG